MYLLPGDSSLYIYANGGAYGGFGTGGIVAAGLGGEIAGRSGSTFSAELGFSRFFPEPIQIGFVDLRIAWGYRF